MFEFFSNASRHKQIAVTDLGLDLSTGLTPKNTNLVGYEFDNFNSAQLPSWFSRPSWTSVSNLRSSGCRGLNQWFFTARRQGAAKKEEDSSYGSCLEIIARSTIKHLITYHVDELQSKELASSTTTRFSNFCSNGWLSLKETYDLNPRKFPSLSDL